MQIFVRVKVALVLCMRFLAAGGAPQRKPVGNKAKQRTTNNATHSRWIIMCKCKYNINNNDNLQCERRPRRSPLAIWLEMLLVNASNFNWEQLGLGLASHRFLLHFPTMAVNVE